MWLSSQKSSALLKWHTRITGHPYPLVCVPKGSCTMHTASCHKWRAFLCTDVNGCARKECVCMHVVWCVNACMTKRKGKDVQQHSVDFANPATHTTAAINPAVFFGSPCIKWSQHYQYYLTQSNCTLSLQNWYRPFSGQDLWWTLIPSEMPNTVLYSCREQYY